MQWRLRLGLVGHVHRPGRMRIGRDKLSVVRQLRHPEQDMFFIVRLGRVRHLYWRQIWQWGRLHFTQSVLQWQLL